MGTERRFQILHSTERVVIRHLISVIVKWPLFLVGMKVKWNEEEYDFGRFFTYFSVFGILLKV